MDMKPAKEYQICKRCIMDTTDPNIMFDEDGICNHCKLIMDNRDRYWLPDERGEQKLKVLVQRIKEEGLGKSYDCIMGLSGGVDSSYLALKASEWGLRTLAIHVDAGWNTELAVKNIERMVSALKIDLHTFVIEWEEMRDLQLAFLKAGVPNADIPQDHVFFAALFKETARMNIPYVLTGSNYATESILPSAWGYSARDATHLKSIHKRYGQRGLKKYPTLGFLFFNWYLPKIKKVKIVSPLDLMPYNKRSAIIELENAFGWQYYGGKHCESRFTKFFQGYYLPQKFGFDKRRAHLSSLIASGEITRQEALSQIAMPAYQPSELEHDKNFILSKLGISDQEFESFLRAPQVRHDEFATNQWMYQFWSESGVINRVRVLFRHRFQ